MDLLNINELLNRQSQEKFLINYLDFLKKIKGIY